MKKTKISSQEARDTQDNDHFWERKKLSQMTPEEWESLCDNCGRCCLNKIEYEDTQEIFYTNVSCHLLNRNTCKCKDYQNRKMIVPDCLQLSPRNIKKLSYMPDTCAYRLVAEGKELPQWHPLISKSKSTVHSSGISVRNKVISEKQMDRDLEDYIIDWVKPSKGQYARKQKQKKSAKKNLDS